MDKSQRKLNIYNVEVLTNSPFEHGENAYFQFDDLSDLINFIKLCLDNGHSVEVSKIELE